jgi:CelD/BcsL family acetyltransferase involved in cellulose biosynthesis
MLKIKIIRNSRELPSLEPVWNTLLSASDMDMPFMTFEWFRMYWTLFEKRSEMLVCVLSQDQEPVAIVPLMRIPALWRGVPHSCVTFIANYLSCRTGMINPSGTEVLGQVLDRLHCEGIKYDIFYANFIPADSVTDRELKGYIASSGLPHRALDWNGSPYLPLPPTWEEYLNSREHSIRHNFRRAMRTFDSAEYRLTAYSQPEEFAAGWEKLLEVSRNSWKFRQGTAIANKNIENTFRTIARMAAENGWYRSLILEHLGKPIAFTYELHYRKKLYSMQIGFDESYSKQGPGSYMNCRAIKDAIETGYTEFDFLGKGEEHKLRFTSQVRAHNKYIVFNRSMLGRTLHRYELKVIPLARQALGGLRRKTAAVASGVPAKPAPLYDRAAPAPASSPLARRLRIIRMALVGYPQR